MSLKVVFFGTPQFAAYILNFLVQHHVHIIAAVTQPDRPQGRSDQPTPPAVKVAAMKHHIPVYQPIKSSEPAFANFLKDLHADLFVVAAYREILKDNVLMAPRLGCVNVHASLLPKYRGAAPIQRSIMAGETETGVTIMQMARQLDTGNILSVVKTPIAPDMTAGELEEKLAHIGAPALLHIIHAYENGKVTAIPQNDSASSYAKKLTPEDAEVVWTRPAQEVYNLIRGVTPKPGAWCSIFVRGQKKRLRIHRAETRDFQGNPGQILDSSADELVIGCNQGAISLLIVQLEGKKSMTCKEFLQGFPKPVLSF